MIFIIALFITGLIIAVYPLTAQVYQFYISQQKIETFEKEREHVEYEDIQRRIYLAEIYNETLISLGQTGLVDPFSELEKEARAEYARMLKLEEMIGHVSIPKIDTKIPIYAGTSESILQRGAGHLEGSSLPVGGSSTHAVITAHRGLPQARLFTDLDKLKEGDMFYVTNIRDTLAYQVERIQVIEPHQVETLHIQENRDIVTLLTCTPYMINSHRLLVTGHRVEYIQEVAEEQAIQGRNDTRFVLILSVCGILVVIGIALWHFSYYFKHDRRRR
ncbi:class C sortase [Streptococcus suis]|nr:class C sortase [Streptococcus suis]NRG97665.1 class C sortase [Streptococcus suis]